MNSSGTIDQLESGSFFNELRSKYGHNICELHKNYASSCNKLSRLTSRRMFLLECRHSNVYPKHIIANVNCLYQSIEQNTPYNNELSKAVSSFKKRILNLEIKITCWQIEKLKSDCHNQCHRLQSLNIVATGRFIELQNVRRDRIHLKRSAN